MDNGLIIDDLVGLIQKKTNNGELKYEKTKPTISIIGNINDVEYPKIIVSDCKKEQKYN